MTNRRATAANTGFFFAGALVAALVVQEFNGPVGPVAASSNSTLDRAAVSYSPRTNQGAAYLGNVSLHEKQTQHVWKETKSQQSWVF